MAGGGYIGDADPYPVVEDVEDFTHEYSGVERHGFSGFEVNLATGFGFDGYQERDQRFAVIIGAGDMVAAAKVEPFQLAEIGRDLGFERGPCAFERREVLFA